MGLVENEPGVSRKGGGSSGGGGGCWRENIYIIIIAINGIGG